MLAKILGWLFIVLGTFFFLKPAFFKKILVRKSIKKVRKLLFLLAITVGILFISASWKMKEFLPKLIMVLGIVIIIKDFFFIKGKISEKLLGWFSKKPLIYFKFFSLIYIVIGVLILMGLKK
ncbi:MAG: hypothetical protein DRP68_01945 [Candidatus Omnitrophota bacterium]|nr:MAG: hypothetical protein DRP68_01945 [Candidatus Omnitrophota bacterium]